MENDESRCGSMMDGKRIFSEGDQSFLLHEAELMGQGATVHTQIFG